MGDAGSDDMAPAVLRKTGLHTTRVFPPPIIPRPLRYGAKGDDVKDLQVLLYDRGLYVHRIDGRYSNHTRNAVAQLQRRVGVRATGQFDERTIEAL